MFWIRSWWPNVFYVVFTCFPSRENGFKRFYSLSLAGTMILTTPLAGRNICVFTWLSLAGISWIIWKCHLARMIFVVFSDNLWLPGYRIMCVHSYTLWERKTQQLGMKVCSCDLCLCFPITCDLWSNPRGEELVDLGPCGLFEFEREIVGLQRRDAGGSFPRVALNYGTETPSTD